MRVFRSGKGDCLLLTSETGRHILVDGGVPDAYQNHCAAKLGSMRKKKEPIDLLCISHIDRDHIGGVLSMLDNEVAWRVHEIRKGLPAHLKPKPKKNPPPTVPRPPEIKDIWHNAFFEEVQDVVINDPGMAAAPDIVDGLFRAAGIFAGGKDAMLPDDAASAESLTASQAAEYLQFLGQSVGDAIEVSRRIADDQLGIPRNDKFGGDFVLRTSAATTFNIAGMKVRVLGPTKEELEELVADWDEWLNANAAYLQRLIDKHERDAGNLAQSSPAAVLARAREMAIALAGNQSVTPPNLASIILHVEENGRTILLTGDADDPGILAGLENAGLTDGNGIATVDVLKVPHHGAHNSYSDELARRVLASHYVFCGDGEHENPETEVLNDYLEVLLEGKNAAPPALPNGERIKFWFNCGPDLVTEERKAIVAHWNDIETLLTDWHDEHPNRFRFKLMKRGDSFLVR